MGSYVSKNFSVYRCPSDCVLSPLLARRAGCNRRDRSYSMNASVGDAGTLSQTGVNTNNPGYLQFFKLTSMPAPAWDRRNCRVTTGQHFGRGNLSSRLLGGMDPAAGPWHDGGATLFSRGRTLEFPQMEVCWKHQTSSAPGRGQPAAGCDRRSARFLLDDRRRASRNPARARTITEGMFAGTLCHRPPRPAGKHGSRRTNWRWLPC